MRRQVWCLFGTLALCAFIEHVDASVLYSAPQMVQGTQAYGTPLQIPGAGELTLTLSDLQFPKAFAALTFTVSDAQMALTGPTGAGTLSLNLTGPATLYADVFATAAQSASDSGLYSLTATFLGQSPAPVPLPASGALFAGALLAAALALGWSAPATVTARMA
jgi:hypothetical protein